MKNVQRITKEDLSNCRVNYFQNHSLVDCRYDGFESVREAIYHSQKDYNRVEIYSFNSEKFFEYAVTKSKTYKRIA